MKPRFFPNQVVLIYKVKQLAVLPKSNQVVLMPKPNPVKPD